MKIPSDNSSSGSGSMGSSGNKKKADGRRRRKGPGNIISFDDDNVSQSMKASLRPFDFSSAPATCLSSPNTVPATHTDQKSDSFTSAEHINTTEHFEVKFALILILLVDMVGA